MVLLGACRKDEVVFLQEDIPVDPPTVTPEEKPEVLGFYQLNEGNMGMNASTLDYYDYSTGVYQRNIFANVNPDVPKELGDVGNDLAIYGSRMYAVINCSNKVEVMEAATARRIGQVDIPNCRHIVFHGGKAYVTSYAGPVEINPDYTQRGYVARVDTASLAVEVRCVVGFQPDGLAIDDGKIYVANSGGYMVPNYENTLSVIDLDSFSVTDTIQIAINLQYVKKDRHGALWVSSRGDYYGTPARLFRYDLAERKITDTFPLTCGHICMAGDSLYVCGSSFSYETYEEVPTYAIIDTEQRRVVNDQFVSDEVRRAVVKPYGLAVNPSTGDILLTDAGNYVNPGYVYCLSADGQERWRVRAGDIPAHFAFLEQTPRSTRSSLSSPSSLSSQP